MVGDHCAFVLVPGDVTNRCFASLGDCAFDEDCNLSEICEPALDERLGGRRVEPFGSCAVPGASEASGQ
jgi:hypothetical protein